MIISLKCRRCNEPALKSSPRLCAKHARFRMMRRQALIDRKAVPTIEQIEALFAALDAMRCPHCQREMAWKRQPVPAMQMTLQHYRSGAFGLICFSCNSRHAASEDDTILPPGMKRCKGCKQVKPFADFRPDSNRPATTRFSYCFPCDKARKLRWYYENKKRAVVA
jgi:hypothetical protein